MTGDTHKVRTVSLADLLQEHDAPMLIDYLSVDTEGSEYEILSAFPFGSRTIRLVYIEHNNQPIERELDRLMAAHGYERRFPELSGWDAWYRLRTMPEREASVEDAVTSTSSSRDRTARGDVGSPSS